MAAEQEQEQQIISFILKEIIRRPGYEIDTDTPLVSSGLVDSFALVDVILKMEEVLDVRVPRGKIQPNDMETVRQMFSTVEKVSRPRR